MEYSIGNMKIGSDTLIFNLGSATTCPSGLSGQCDLHGTNKCYALKAERMYKSTLPYRERQGAWWKSHTAEEIAEAINAAISRKLKTKIKFVRWNEAGDISGPEDLEKMATIAQMTPQLKFYTYTHNQQALDQFLTNGGTLPANLVINLSNFRRPGFNSFMIDTTMKVQSLKKDWKAFRTLVRDRDGHSRTCIGDCSKCSLCKVSHGKDILVPLH